MPLVLLSNLQWKLFGNLNSPRQLFGAVAISKTEVLVIGGFDNNGNALSSCEIIDVSNGTITPGPKMNFPHAYFVTIVTKDTNIFVISGCTQGSAMLTPSVEMYDKIKNSWKFIGDLIVPRWQHNAEFLNDHEILVVGGRHADLSVMDDVEIFDINTGQNKKMNPYVFPTSDGVSGYTSDGKLIFFGGRSGGENSTRSRNIYYYNQTNDSWIRFDNVNRPIQIPSMYKLWDNRLILIGGSYQEIPTDFSKEIFIENSGYFSYESDMIHERIRFSASQYNNDTLIIIGGLTDNGTTNQCDWYNINSISATNAPTLITPRSNFCSISLPSNNKNRSLILAIGGRDNNLVSTSSVEILTYPSPAITNVSTDCDNYYFTVSDSNLIDSVRLTGPNNKNVSISVLESLPANLVHVVVSLIDPKSDGFFNATCYCNYTGLSTVVSDRIYSKVFSLNFISPIKNGLIDFGDTVVNTVKCVDVLIENTGQRDITLDSAMLLINKEFSIPPGQLPMLIPAGMQKLLRICFAPTAQGVFLDTLFFKEECDSLRFPIAGRGFIFTPPYITGISSDCSNYYFTVVDTNLIDTIKFKGTDNKNVSFSVVQKLPAMLVYVVVSLIDPKQDGFFKITCISNRTGLSVDISDTIYSKVSSLNFISPIKNGAIDFGDTVVNKVKCVDVLIENTGKRDVTIDSAMLLINKEFFIPPGQLPMLIPAGTQKVLRICFAPDSQGIFLDTLFFKDECDSLNLPIVARGLIKPPPYITGISSDCFNFYFTVSDTNLIDSISFAPTKNVVISIIEKLPAQVVHCKVTLVDSRLDGYFTATAYCNFTGFSTSITDTLQGNLSYLNVLFPQNTNVVIVGDTVVNAVKCADFQISNSGTGNLTISAADFLKNTEFSFPNNQLPLMIPPGEQRTLRICFSANVVGIFYDTLYLKNLCDSLAVPVNGTALENKPAEILEFFNDCGIYYITAADSNWINRVELIGNENKNVKLTVLDSIPARVVHVIISLINPNQDGFFNVTFYCNATNKSLDFSDTLYSHPSYLIVVAPLDSNGVIQAGDTESGIIKCVNVLIQNTGSADIVLDEARLWRNVEFSIPQGQLPLTIPAGGRGKLELCYLPSEFGLQYDTLYIKDLCDTLGIPVKATGDTSYYSGKSNCNIDVNLQTVKMGKLISIKTPYPNPGSNFVNVTVSETSPEAEKCVLYDFKGESVLETQADNISIQQSGIEIYYEKEYRINLTNLSSGMYFIVVETAEGKRVFPYFVIK